MFKLILLATATYCLCHLLLTLEGENALAFTGLVMSVGALWLGRDKEYGNTN